MFVKTFSFVISNSTLKYVKNTGDYAALSILRKQIFEGQTEFDDVKLYTPDEIDEIVNKFLMHQNVVDIKVNTEVLYRNNNGYADTVLRTYTIICR